jgi:hypothetical protein
MSENSKKSLIEGNANKEKAKAKKEIVSTNEPKQNQR